MSGVDLGHDLIRKGAVDAIEAYVRQQGGAISSSVRAAMERVAREGGTPLVVAEKGEVLGVVELRDIVRGGSVSASPSCAAWASRRS